MAALISWIVFRSRVTLATWIAIFAVLAGVTVMVSGSFGKGASSPTAWIGDCLALIMAGSFAVATVITRQYRGVEMTPAVTVGIAIAGAIAATQASGLGAVGMGDMAWLVVFGAVNLGLGMAFFVTGARLIPATLTALLGTTEPVLGPIWVWLVHHETPASTTIIGGGIVFAALTAHILYGAARGRS